MTSIIHELTLIQEREGWLSDESLRAVAEKLSVPLHRVESVSTFYTHYRRTEPKPFQVHICRDLSCFLAGGRKARDQLLGELAGRSDCEVHEVSCLGRCEMAPAAAIGHGTVCFADTAATVCVTRLARSTASPPPAPSQSPR